MIIQRLLRLCAGRSVIESTNLSDHGQVLCICFLGSTFSRIDTRIQGLRSAHCAYNPDHPDNISTVWILAPPMSTAMRANFSSKNTEVTIVENVAGVSQQIGSMPVHVEQNPPKQ